jgi:hypothetical protein
MVYIFNPSNRTFVSSIDYKFQNSVTSGAFFGLRYQSGTFIYRLDESTSIFAPKFLLDSSVYVHTHSPPSLAKVIGIPTYNTPNVYTVTFKDGTLADYTDDLLSAATTSLSPRKSLLPSWIKGGSNATLFLHDMPKPKHGTLHLTGDKDWIFFPGKQTTTNGISLPDLEANCQELLDTGQLFRGHAKFRNVYDTRNQIALQHCVLHHVTAHTKILQAMCHLDAKSIETFFITASPDDLEEIPHPKALPTLPKRYLDTAAMWFNGCSWLQPTE